MKFVTLEDTFIDGLAWTSIHTCHIC